jgi:hypothetical protein
MAQSRVPSMPTAPGVTTRQPSAMSAGALQPAGWADAARGQPAIIAANVDPRPAVIDLRVRGRAAG